MLLGRKIFHSVISKHKFSTNSNTKATIDIKVHQSIVDKCFAVRESLQAISDRCKGPLEKSSQKNTVLPFVFLLGNHSSGKSSFINYVIQRKIQVTGVAPTDDTFTIIVPGPSDVDRDGPAFVGDPGLYCEFPSNYNTHLIICKYSQIWDFLD